MSGSGTKEKPGTESAVLEGYRQRWRHHDEARARASGRSRRLSTVRGFTFLGAVGAVVAIDFVEGPAEGVALAVLGGLIAGFVGLVVVHRRTRAEEEWEASLAAVAREGLLRCERRWVELEDALPEPERAPAPVPPDHPYAADLDLMGRASLWRLLGPVTATGAREVLRGWLLEPGRSGEARRRQAAVRELAPHEALRSEFTALGRRALRDRSGSWDRFLTWVEGEGAFRSTRAWGWLGVLLPVALVGTIVGDVVLGFGPWWILVGAPQLVVFRKVSRGAAPSFQAASTASGAARAAVPQLRLLDGTEWRSERLVELRHALGEGDGAAHRGLAELLRLLDTVESRRNIVYATLAPFFLLDLHLALALDRWRGRNGVRVGRWLEAGFEWEALAALATLAHDNPGWAYPELSGKAPVRIVSTGLGHPLLHPDRCVRNDVELGPPGTFLLVTGSNMSGKSTLLRAIGLNAVLAGVGAPACVREAVMPCTRVFTCMRIDDSLEEGVSLFMAELLRIRAVVREARAPDPEGRPVLYLLDEMLHGTNTAERRVAARGVVRHLLDAGALGAVSTHDLAFAESPGLQGAADPVHFREHVSGDGPDGGPLITFDYRMRPGIATTRNALKLLEAVGLSLPDDASAPPAGH